ncbi:MAG TPA: hypothetical protein VLA71_08710 [Algoriphagus sp.]|nr:hypothetical protein [Algoriphagus sp.]
MEKKAEVLAIHDEVMPKMGQLKSLEKKALQRANELAARDTVDSVQVESLKKLAIELDQAYEGMFDWMRQYESDDQGKSPEEVKVYLEEQMISVSEVNRIIKETLSKADSVLKN